MLSASASTALTRSQAFPALKQWSIIMFPKQIKQKEWNWLTQNYKGELSKLYITYYSADWQEYSSIFSLLSDIKSLKFRILVKDEEQFQTILTLTFSV